MRILFLNLYLPPDTSATARVAASMVHALAQSHHVTVLCGRPSYDPTERRSWKLWQTERLSPPTDAGTKFTGSITVIRVGSTDYSRVQMKARLLNYLTYAKLAFYRALFLPCDVIFSMTDPPFEGILAALLATLKRKPLFYNIQDLYPDMAVAGSIVQPGPLARLWERLHRWALRRAARIVVLGEDMRARIIAKGISPEKISIVRNVADSSYAPASCLNPSVIQIIRENFSFVVLHAGNLGFYGAWDTIIAAARLLEKENIGFVFVGEGAERARLESLASAVAATTTSENSITSLSTKTGGSASIPAVPQICQHSNIRFLPFFPAADIPSVLAAPDVHIVTIKKGLEGVVVPSKMFGILAAAKPILAVAASETDVANLGVLHGFAISCDPDDPKALADAVLRLAGDLDLLNTMALAASAFSRTYSRATELARLVALVDSGQRAGK